MCAAATAMVRPRNYAAGVAARPHQGGGSLAGSESKSGLLSSCIAVVAMVWSCDPAKVQGGLPHYAAWAWRHMHSVPPELEHIQIQQLLVPPAPHGWSYNVRRCVDGPQSQLASTMAEGGGRQALLRRLNRPWRQELHWLLDLGQPLEQRRHKIYS